MVFVKAVHEKQWMSDLELNLYDSWYARTMLLVEHPSHQSRSFSMSSGLHCVCLALDGCSLCSKLPSPVLEVYRPGLVNHSQCMMHVVTAPKAYYPEA